MRVYDYKVIVEPDEEAGGYVVSCPAFEGCYSQGETIAEALDNIREAILLCLEDLQEQAMPLPDASKMLIGSVAVAI